MILHTAYAVIEAERTGKRDGFSHRTAVDGPGNARRGWYFQHPTRAEYVGPTWPAVVASATELVEDADKRGARDAAIIADFAKGRPLAEIATENEVSISRVSQIARAAGLARGSGRRATGEITIYTAAGKAALDTLREHWAALRALTDETDPRAVTGGTIERALATEAIARVVARAELAIAEGKPPEVGALLAELGKAIASTRGRAR